MSRLPKVFSNPGTSSTSQESLQGAVERSTLCVTLLSREWRSSTNRDLSTVNRELAIQLAKHPSVQVSVFLPQCSEDDKRIAASHKVQLIEAEEMTGADPVDWLISIPEDHTMDCIIGHGVHLGRQIPLIQRSHQCKWIQIVHNAPEELAMYKRNAGAIPRGEQMQRTEIDLCELADQVVTVGPKLADTYRRFLRSSEKHQDVIDLTPSIFTEFSDVKQATEERKTFCVLIIGSGDSEDFNLKGCDLAAQAIAELKENSYQLRFVCAPRERGDEIAEKLLKHGIDHSQLIVRSFNESRETLARLFREVDLAIMPSRSEGFGLIALEALSAGLPVLVSSNSGLGEALMKVPNGSNCVVDSEDPKHWAKKIKAVREKDRDVRLAESKLLREKYLEKYSWQEPCGILVEKMWNLVTGPSSHSVPPSFPEYYQSSHFPVGTQTPAQTYQTSHPQTPADQVPEGTVTGEVSGTAASTCDSGHSAGVRSAQKQESVEQAPADLVPGGTVTGEVSCAAASTCDNGHSTGVRSAWNRESVERGVLSWKMHCVSATSRYSGKHDPQERSEIVNKYMAQKIDEVNTKGTFDLSSFEGLEDFYAYLCGHLLLVDTCTRIQKSSIKITVKCCTLEILGRLWDDYCSGHLNAEAEKCLITENLKEELGMETIKLATTILEEDYLSCKSSLMETAVDIDDEDFNLIQPSLIQQLRKILDEYPDDGQILKELIQNAEDAGATEVKFLYDKHSYGTKKLLRKSLARFQGPALYAYNNAQFSKDDWRGIRMICDSIKVKDPTKVGQFGLGFKSVFHMTDLPSILSGQRIGFIDPHEEHFSPSTGFDCRLNRGHATPDQVAPYKGVFDCDEEVFHRGHYDGTLFRFPLRTAPSELSKTVYSVDKVTNLLDSFMADAHLVLLFLQNLEAIELFVREESEVEPRRVFQVKISDECAPLARSKRKEFFAAVVPDIHMAEPVTVTYPITIEIEADCYAKSHSFLVTSYCCGGQVSAQFERLLTDKDLSYLPSVGVAMALPSEANPQTPDISGHVFCVLPLPVQAKSMTGLPVHVNGFFALTQNRGHIKTPNVDQEEPAKLTDKSLLWNCCLLGEAVPRAYATLISKAIESNVPAEAIYKAWPDINSIDPTWKKLQDPLLRVLCSTPVIFTEAGGGKWLRIKEAILDRLQENDARELLLQVLFEAHQNVATLPDHVIQCITSHTHAISEVTPSFVRVVLKNTPSCYRPLGRTEKFCLLKFVLKDDLFSELQGLELLPLSDGTFATFKSSDIFAVYMSSPEHPAKLLPGLRHRILAQDVGFEILAKLKEVAQRGNNLMK